MRAVLLDIEGTTTPIDFVHKTLFPFARAQMRDFVRGNSLEIQAEIAQLRGEHADDFGNGDYREIFDESYHDSVGAYLQFLIDIDRKSTPLKSIQGKIWQKGYESGSLVSEIFDDVPAALKLWKSENKTVAIYSSGSVLAQKLIFKYSDHGDLTPLIDHYFDTNIGRKLETESFRKIALELRHEPENIVFVSDIVEELDAARAARMQTVLSIRNGNSVIKDRHTHASIQTFDELTHSK